MKDAKVVLVAGASSGLGKAVAQYLYEKGFTVYAGARSYREETSQRDGENGGELRKVFLDVTDESSIHQLVERIMGEQGRIDVLVNSAAVITLGPVEEIGMDEFENVMNTCFAGTVRMCRSVVPHMREKGRGLIINFSSGAGLIGIPFQSAYCSAKHAIEGFTEALRWEMKTFGVDAVLIEPGDNNAGSEKYRLVSRNVGDDASPYAGDFKTVSEKIASDEANGAGPEAVAKAVYSIICVRRTHIRYRVFKTMGERMLPSKMLLPNWFAEMCFFGYYNLKPKKNGK